MHQYFSMLTAASALAAGMTGVSLMSGIGLPSATAALLSVEITGGSKGGNACPGYFEASSGGGFDSCDIGNPFDTSISPVIAKYEVDEDIWEVNPLYEESVDGSEWTLTGLESDTGTWSYSPNDPEDPAVRYWAAKGGTGFTLFWEVADTTTESGGAACLTEVGESLKSRDARGNGEVT